MHNIFNYIFYFCNVVWLFDEDVICVKDFIDLYEQHTTSNLTRLKYKLYVVRRDQ